MVMAPSNDDSRQSGGNSPAGDDARTVVALAGGQNVFGRYELESIAGRGGMGVVWRARDRELERIVALKFLPEMVSADPEAVKELKGETRRCLQLTHPNIVRVHDFIQAGTLAAISMEFVPGASLARLKADAPGHCLPLHQLSPLTVQLCDALDYAHQSAAIVHRDLKPANLLVSEQGQLKVTDFGIARSLSETHTRLTNSMGSTSGTLLYMSPQQLMGDKPTPSDDIYALGATLYEMLAGKPPFHRGDGFSLMTQIREKAPPSLAAKRVELEINGELIPPEWEAAIIACLEKDPANRPATAREVASRIGLTASGSAARFVPIPTTPTNPTKSKSAASTTLPPTPVASAAPAAPRARSFPWKAVVAALLVIAIAKSVHWVFTRNSPRPETVAQVPVSAPTLPSAEPVRAEPARVEPRPEIRAEPVHSEPLVAAKPNPITEAMRPPAVDQQQLLAEREILHRVALEQAEKLQREERERREEAIAASEEQAKLEREDETVIAEVTAKNARALPGDTPAGENQAPGSPGFFRRTWSKVKTINPIHSNSTTKDAGKTEGATAATAVAEGQSAVEEPTTPPATGKEWTTPTAGLRLVWIPPGTFNMGSPVSEPGHEENEGPQTRVRLTKGFWLGATPVTHRQWAALMAKDPSDYSDHGLDAPVEQVSWHAAIAYCRRLNEREAAAGRLPEGYAYTLPTEAEWEYACRAGTTTAQYAALDTIAWYEVNRGPRKGPHPVAQKQPNAWGLHDMLGNVFQWCRGWDNTYTGGERTDRAGVTGGERRIARGGGWSSSALYCRAAFRLRLKSGSEENNVGFRVALAPLPSSP